MFHPISVLKLPKNEILKLNKQGIYYCTDCPDQLYENLINPPQIKSCADLLQEECDYPHFRTHNNGIDALFENVLQPGTITELCGLPGSGKTQLCFHLSCADGVRCLFIDTKGSFSYRRLKVEIINQSGRSDSILQQIHCIETITLDELIAMGVYLEVWLQENRINCLIIDSISWPFRQINEKHRIRRIYNFLEQLRVLADSHKFAILITNDISTRPTDVESSSCQCASLGDCFYHIVNTRIYVKRLCDEFEGTLLKSQATMVLKKISFNTN